jgi:hypothetical protein
MFCAIRSVIKNTLLIGTLLVPDFVVSVCTYSCSNETLGPNSRYFTLKAPHKDPAELYYVPSEYVTTRSLDCLNVSNPRRYAEIRAPDRIIVHLHFQIFTISKVSRPALGPIKEPFHGYR